MKKLSALILAVLCILSFSVISFAESIDEGEYDAYDDSVYDEYDDSYDEVNADGENAVLYSYGTAENEEDAGIAIIGGADGPTEVYVTEGESSFKPVVGIIISVIVGLLIALIVTSSYKAELKSVHAQTDADVYTAEGSMNVTVRKDTFLYKKLEKTPRPKQNQNPPPKK